MFPSASKCSIVSQNANGSKVRNMKLAEDVLKVEDKAAYLGIIIDSKGAKDDKTVERILAARRRLEMMKTLRMYS